MIDLFKRFLSSLSDAELGLLNSEVYAETEKRRVIKRANFGSGLPALNEAEMAFVSAGQKINAIKAYRLRVGSSLKEAKDEVEDYISDSLQARFANR